MNRSISETTMWADKHLFIFDVTRREVVQNVGSYRSLYAHCTGAAGRGRRHRAG